MRFRHSSILGSIFLLKWVCCWYKGSLPEHHDIFLSFPPLPSLFLLLFLSWLDFSLLWLFVTIPFPSLLSLDDTEGRIKIPAGPIVVMEPSPSSHGYDSKRSSMRRSGAAAIQTAADTMIAVTESLRQHYHEQQAKGPSRPKPAYSHSRSSSGSSASSAGLLDASVTPMSVSRDSLFQPTVDGVSVPDALVPGPRNGRESQALMQPSMEELESSVSTEDLGIIIRLSTPNLPPRLDTPHTTNRLSSFGVEATEEAAPEPITIDSNPMQPSYAPARQNSILETARHFGPFKSARHSYTALRPDCGTDTRPFGTVTHIRGGSDGEPLVSKEFRRKPLAPHARRISFNHSSLTNEVSFVIVICLSQVLMFAGFAQALIPARIIGDSLTDNSVTSRAWYSAAYTLTAGVFVLLGNRLGRIFGNKTIFVIGYAWFSLWSLLAGLCVYLETGKTAYFCFCRAMQGIGPALLVPNGQVMLRSAYPPGPRKTLVMGLFDAAAPSGFVIGAAMSSLFSEWSALASWPWSFYTFAAVSFALAALSALLIPGKNVQMHNLDGPMFVRLNGCGLFLSITGLVLFSVGWNQAPVVSFDSADTYVLIFTGAVLFIGYGFLESKTTHPLIPFKKIRLASAGIILLANASLWAAFGIWIWYLVLSFETVRGWNGLELSAGFVPLLVGGIAASLLDRFLLDNKCQPRRVMLIASLSVLISSLLMALASEDQSYWMTAFPSILIMAFGMVLANPSAVTLLFDNVPEGHLGLTTGLVGTTASYAVSIGLGMAGAVEVHVREDQGKASSGAQAAQYFGAALSGLSVLLSGGFFLASYIRR